MQTFVSDGRLAWWAPAGVLVGAAVSSFQHSLATGALVSLFAIPLFFFNRWIIVRWCTVELSDTQLTGPARKMIFKRVSFPLAQLDRVRSARRGFIGQWYGHWDLFSLTGECVRVPCGMLGTKNTEALMSALGFVSDEAKWARRRTDFGWFILAAWAVFAFLVLRTG